VGQETPVIWREALWGLDWLSLRLSPVYMGLGVPHGDGSPVVLVPGFLTTDAHLMEMHLWLRRIGYSSFLSGIGINADCILTLARRLERTVEEACREKERPVRLIGHSLGGFVARNVALRRPDIVTQLISLGSPIQAMEAHPAIMAAARFVGKRVERLQPQEPGTRRGSGICLSNHCQCLSESGEVPCPPPSVRRAAVYSRDDGLMPWRNCLEPEPSLNHEVGGTHIGLVFNPHVYRIVANLLAQATAARHPRAA
jgi:pimeloyl-ACP methyl ester carboxylesterase